jgi:ribosomal protein S27AE
LKYRWLAFLSALFVSFASRKEAASADVQWCPDCGGPVTVRPDRLDCPRCGWWETDPGMA